MRRRDFLALVGGATAASAMWSFVRAQDGERVRHLGVLMPFVEGDAEGRSRIAAFRDALQKLGWTEGKNLRVDYRWSPPGTKELQDYARQLLALKPEILFSPATPTTTALRQQPHQIPIVFTNIADPIGSGFVESLARPGGRVTGFTNLEPTLGGKWLELLKEVAPHVSRAAFLFNPKTAPYAGRYMDSFKAAATQFKVEAIAAPVHDKAEIESALAALAQKPNGGFIVIPDSFLVGYRADITALAAQHRLPAVYSDRTYAEMGGLLCYGNDRHDNYRRAAGYVDRILRGATPAELPVQAPVKFEFVINLKTAKALGLAVPLILQQRADEVIE